MRAADAEGFAGTALLAQDPYAAFAKIASLFDTHPAFEPGVHASAAIDPSADVDPGAHVERVVLLLELLVVVQRGPVAVCPGAGGLRAGGAGRHSHPPILRAYLWIT